MVLLSIDPIASSVVPVALHALLQELRQRGLSVHSVLHIQVQVGVKDISTGEWLRLSRVASSGSFFVLLRDVLVVKLAFEKFVENNSAKLTPDNEYGSGDAPASPEAEYGR